MQAKDYTIVAAQLGHRVYSYEPTPSRYSVCLRNMQLANEEVEREAAAARPWKIVHTTERRNFSSAGGGTVLFRRAVAVSDHAGTAPFAVSSAWNGAANSLNGRAAVPRNTRVREAARRQT